VSEDSEVVEDMSVAGAATVDESFIVDSTKCLESIEDDPTGDENQEDKNLELIEEILSTEENSEVLKETVPCEFTSDSANIIVEELLDEIVSEASDEEKETNEEDISSEAEEMAKDILEQVFKELSDSEDNNEVILQEETSTEAAIESIVSVVGHIEESEEQNESVELDDTDVKEISSKEAIESFVSVEEHRDRVGLDNTDVKEISEEASSKEAIESLVSEEEHLIDASEEQKESVESDDSNVKEIPEESNLATSQHSEPTVIEQEEEPDTKSAEEEIKNDVCEDTELLTQKMQDLSGKIGNTLKLVQEQISVTNEEIVEMEKSKLIDTDVTTLVCAVKEFDDVSDDGSEAGRTDVSTDEGIVASSDDDDKCEGASDVKDKHSKNSEATSQAIDNSTTQ